MKPPQAGKGGERIEMDEQVMADADVQDMLKKFAAPLAEYAAVSPARKANADFMIRTLWTAMIAGPEMEEETWKAFREIARLPEEDPKAIQDCYNQRMKPVVTLEQLTTLRKRYGLRRKS